MPRDHLAAIDLGGGELVVTIEEWKLEKVTAQGGRSERKPVLFFREIGLKPGDQKRKGLVLNVTNCEAIERAHGTDDIDGWLGKEVTLYPATTRFGNGPEVPCIRIRPEAPQRKKQPSREETLGKLVAAYAAVQVTEADILRRIGKDSLEEITLGEIEVLRAVYRKISKDMSLVDEEFPPDQGEQADEFRDFLDGEIEVGPSGEPEDGSVVAEEVSDADH